LQQLFPENSSLFFFLHGRIEAHYR
jgi:hypothetical protein